MVAPVDGLPVRSRARPRKQFEAERTIAETLQRSVLPASLPRIANVELAARYLPGTDDLDVGGDWFDVLQLPTGKLGLVVGDVVGKGVQAAASMAQLRNAHPGILGRPLKPSSMLARLNRLADERSTPLSRPSLSRPRSGDRRLPR